MCNVVMPALRCSSLSSYSVDIFLKKSLLCWWTETSRVSHSQGGLV